MQDISEKSKIMKTDKNKEQTIQEENSSEDIDVQVMSSEESDGNNPTIDNNSEKEDSEDEAPTLDELLNQYQEEKEEYQNKYLRTLAEFDNYRKRVMREKAELILNGGERIITEILPVLDDIERAEANMSSSDDIGVHLIFEKLKKILSNNGLSKIESVGEPFNVDYHEAVAMVPGQPEDLKGKVIDCVQDGYKLNDKVIRHCKVAVAE